MFYLVEECGDKPNGVLRYTICSTEEQYDKAIDESPFTFADGWTFDTKEELLTWFREFVAVPIKA